MSNNSNKGYFYFSKILGLDLTMLLEDSVYIIKRQDHAEEYKQMVSQYRTRYKNGLIMGGSFGMAFILSLRRYFPATFSGFSVNRFLIESIIIGGSLFGSTVSVVLGGSQFVHNIKKDYILKADPDIYKYLQQFSAKYQVSEQTQVRYLLQTEQFNEWNKYRHMSNFFSPKVV